jgi:hypothetical protein
MISVKPSEYNSYGSLNEHYYLISDCKMIYMYGIFNGKFMMDNGYYYSYREIAKRSLFFLNKKVC